jgi:hypothetical protein
VTIEKSKSFTLRHNEDVTSLLNIVGENYKNKLKYEMCPTVWYVNKYWKPQMLNEINDKYIAIEIKDDREWRRYSKVGKTNYYNELTKIKNSIFITRWK